MCSAVMDAVDVHNYIDDEAAEGRSLHLGPRLQVVRLGHSSVDNLLEEIVGGEVEIIFEYGLPVALALLQTMPR